MITLRNANETDLDELEILFKLTQQHTFTSKPSSKFQIGDYKKTVEGEEVWVTENNGKILKFG